MYKIGDKVVAGGTVGEIVSEQFTTSWVAPEDMDSHRAGYDMRSFGGAYKVRFADGKEYTFRLAHIRRA